MLFFIKSGGWDCSFFRHYLSMAKRSQNLIGKIRALTIILFVCFASYCFFYSRTDFKTFGLESAQAQTRPQTKTGRKPQTSKPPVTAPSRYSQFSHAVAAHKQACNSCHKFPSENWKQVRKEGAAFPDITDYPKHESCVNCHREQFFRGSPPTICSICHTNPSPNNSTRHPFPNPREIFDKTPKGREAVSYFEIFFPHDKHVDIVSQNETGSDDFVKASFKPRRQEEASCAVCHQTYQPQGNSDDEFATKPPADWGDRFWLKKGTFKISPIGHERCFTCHSEDSGISPLPADCATCHKTEQAALKTDFDLKQYQTMKIADRIIFTSWRERVSAGTFRHEFASHAELSCSTCHNAAAINTIDARTRKVAVTSCAPCHITATADDGGALNFEVDARKKNAKFQCSKCHVLFGASPIPESHVKAIAAAGN